MGKLFNRARMTVAGAPGTGTIALGSAAPGAQTFAAAGLADGDVVSYVAESGYSNGIPAVWEYGQGTYAAAGPTLARTTVQGGSSGASPVALGADAHVFVMPLAADLSNVKGGPQGWTDQTTTRALATTYTNTSGRPITVSVACGASIVADRLAGVVGGVNVAWSSGQGSGSSYGGLSFDVPAGATYSVISLLGGHTLQKWMEWR